MKPKALSDSIAHFFMILFVYTGFIKLFDLHTFKLELTSSPYLSSVADLMSWALPITELLLVILLIVPAWRIKGLYGSLILMGLFTLYLLDNVFINKQLTCGCGGIIENLRPGQHLIFNLASVILAWIALKAAKYQESQRTPRFYWVSTTLTTLLFCSICWIIFTAAVAPPTYKTGKEGRTLPPFNILLLDSTSRLNIVDIHANTPFMVIGFSPYCPHCQREISDIVHNIAKFQNIHIYLVSTFPIGALRKFDNKFSIHSYPNITIGRDDKNTYLSYFDWHSIPFTTIYDSHKRLTEAIYGRADISYLLRCLDF